MEPRRLSEPPNTIDGDHLTPHSTPLRASHEPLKTKELPTKEGSVEDTEKPDSKLVTWSGPDDPTHPLQLSPQRKLAIAASAGFLTFSVSLASSIIIATIFAAGAEFHASTEVMALGVSLYVLGLGFGPILWGPMSELYGRTKPLFGSMVIFLFLQVPWGLARNLEAVFISRFFAGVFGSSALIILPAVAGDCFDAIQLGVVGMLFYANIFSGPCIGPVIGAFITQDIGWRWTAWITLIITALATTLIVWGLPETYHPLLLRWKAEKMRQETKDWALHAQSEEHSIDFKTLRTRYLTRPVDMIVREPILIFFTLYMSLVYALIYLTFQAFPASFLRERGWEFGVSTLPFLALMGGVFLACIITAVFTKRWLAPRLVKRNGKRRPEDRLPMVILGSFMVPGALFWFAWTSDPSINAASQIVAAVFIGCGMILVWISSYAYIMDVYTIHVASASVPMALIRSILAAAFVMFGEPMYKHLGVDWASSVVAFVFVAMVPFPILFLLKGEKIRGWSRYAFDD